VLIEQTYPGVDDYRRHFEALLPALHDGRYVRVDGRPVIVVFLLADVPDPHVLASVRRDAAQSAGLPGLHLVAFDHGVGFHPVPGHYVARVPFGLARIFQYPGAGVLRRARRRVRREPRHERLARLDRRITDVL
jgi:hypothetical protein